MIFRTIGLLSLSFCLNSFFIYPSYAEPLSLSEQRAIFLNAEQSFAQKDEVTFLAQMQQLKEYPLYPYLQMLWLKRNLNHSEEIKQFLTEYKETRYANVFRHDWLEMLAKNKQWQSFVDYYQADSTDAEDHRLQCYFAWANYNLDHKEMALNLAKELWLNVKNDPEACKELFTTLSNSTVFNQTLLWQRFTALLKRKKPDINTAIQLKRYMTIEDQRIANLWLKVYEHPELIRRKDWIINYPQADEIFAFGIERMIDKNLSTAIGLWDNYRQQLKLLPDSIDYIEQRFGLALVKIGDFNAAYYHLNQVINPNEEARQWLIRVALSQQNWLQISQALTKLLPAEKNEDKWQYWLARSEAANGRINEAKTIFTELAKKASFYGFLAADELKQPYQIIDKPIVPDDNELDQLQQHHDIQIFTEFVALNRPDEALSQWWYIVKHLEPRQVMLAAKLAQFWQFNKLAIITMAKASYWDDLELRFPLLYTDLIMDSAEKQGLDPAIILGLIRQESIFDQYAGSNVGARGLMQIMPATGKHIAQKLKEPWRSAASLYEPETNIRYGSYYYKKLLDKFNGQVALATAGYNAGPQRVKTWLPEKSMPMDIWIETIPFNETRQYVTVVLSNILFYQQRLKRNSLKISEFMNPVQPVGVANEQPLETVESQ